MPLYLSYKKDMEKKLEGMNEMALASFFHFLEIIKEMELDRKEYMVEGLESEEDKLIESILRVLDDTEKQLKALYRERRTGYRTTPRL